MKRERIIDVSKEERRVAVLEEGKLRELFIKREFDQNIIGNIYLGRIVNVLSGIQSAFVDIGLEKNTFISLDDRGESAQLNRNEKILVQVTKEAWGSKGARVTGDVTLPGRYLVYTPFSKRIGISKNISNGTERERLKSVIKEIAKKEGGFIIRTEACGIKNKDILREGKYLIELWEQIKKKVRKDKDKPLIYESMGIILFAVRELFTDEVTRLLVNSPNTYKAILKYTKRLLPHLSGRVKLYKKNEPIFNIYNIEDQIEQLKNEDVSLPCGGYIIIQQTEALTSVDVNTGSFVRGGNKESTAFKTNVEASEEIVTQLKLRNIGGIIIVDFVDMKEKKNKARLLDLLKNHIKKDKAKIDILPITRMGLLEMTRERKRESIVNKICAPCPYCEGTGRVLSDVTMFIKIKKAIMRKVPGMPSKYINVFLNPKVAPHFDNVVLEGIEKVTKKKIRIRPDYKLHQNEFEITI